MEEQDIYKEGNLFVIKKEIEGKMITFGSFDTLEEAIVERDELEEYGWPYLPDEPEEKPTEEEYGQYISKRDGKFVVSRVIRGKEKIFGEFYSLDLAKDYKYKLIENAWDESFRTKNIGPYGKFISKEGKRFVITRTIKGKVTRFGSYSTLDEAINAREKLIDDNWGVDGEITLFKKGQYGKHITFFKGIYLINKSFDGRVYNFGKFDSLEDAEKAREILLNTNWNQFEVPEDLYSWHFFVNFNPPMQAFEVMNLIGEDFISFGLFDTLENAKLAVQILRKNNWDGSKVPIELYSENSNIRVYGRVGDKFFTVVRKINGQLINYSSFDTLEEAIYERNKLLLSNWVEEIYEEKFDEYIYLGVDDKYYLKNEVNGIMKVFGVFDDYIDAVNARLEFIKNNWALNDLDDEEENNGKLLQYEDILNVYNSTTLIKEPRIPFPQADDFNKVINICEELYVGVKNKYILIDNFDLNNRQYNYYIAAGEYLGLIDKLRNQSSLSIKGIIIFKKDTKEKYLSLVELILEHKPFYDVFSLLLRNKSIPSTDEIYFILKENHLYKIDSDVTLRRRASTVKSWIKWIVSLYD